MTNNQRIYFDNGAKTYFKGCGTSILDGFLFRNGQAGTDLLNLDGGGNSTQLGRLLVNVITCTSSLNVSGNTSNSGSIGIIASSLLARLTLKMSYSHGNTGGFCIDSADKNTYNLRVSSYVQAGG